MPSTAKMGGGGGGVQEGAICPRASYTNGASEIKGPHKSCFKNFPRDLQYTERAHNIMQEIPFQRPKNSNIFLGGMPPDPLVSADSRLCRVQGPPPDHFVPKNLLFNFDFI